MTDGLRGKKPMNETTMINAILFDSIMIFLVLIGLIISIAISDGSSMHSDDEEKSDAKTKND
jgi:hypothetical protein